MKGLLFYHTVNFNAGIGAHHSAGGAADAGLFVDGIGKMITAIVHLLGLKGEHRARAGEYAVV